MSDRPLKRFLKTRKGKRVLADIEDAIMHVCREYKLESDRMLWLMVEELAQRRLDA